ncbi:MAG: signal peptidase II [Frankiaceae bacterium]
MVIPSEASRADSNPIGGQPPRRRAGVRVLLAVAVAVLGLDLVTKIVVVEKLSDRAPVRLLGGLLRLTVTRNSGAAFGLGQGATVLFTMVALAVVVVIVRTAARLRSLRWAATLGLLLGGALGNLLDRILRSPAPFRGHVVDWIELPHWPVFNIADSAIVTGGLVAVLLSVLGLGLDGRRDGHQDRHRDGAADD